MNTLEDQLEDGVRFISRSFVCEMSKGFMMVIGQCVDDVLQFVQDFTVHIEGVGHVCRSVPKLFFPSPCIELANSTHPFHSWYFIIRWHGLNLIHLFAIVLSWVAVAFNWFLHVSFLGMFSWRLDTYHIRYSIAWGNTHRIMLCCYGPVASQLCFSPNEFPAAWCSGSLLQMFIGSLFFRDKGIGKSFVGSHNSIIKEHCVISVIPWEWCVSMKQLECLWLWAPRELQVWFSIPNQQGSAQLTRQDGEVFP